MISPTLPAAGSSVDGFPFHCADCSAEDPQWASLNKGVLICSECCYVHRNLGRHISQVRSLKKGVWDSNQLELMYVLYANGSNNIWEHSLLDPQSSNKIKKKPSPHDPVLPIKENFIKAKYAQSAFTLRPSKDDGPISQDDLNRQLWSCVRTSHVETTLRLLASGADPNYADPEKHNAPLHIAAKEGQSLQVELLWIYGADAAQLNASDLTPSQVAKLENHGELAARLEELQFEVTSRLTMYLCGRRPDHSRQQYFLIPELIGDGKHSAELEKVRQQLHSAPPHFFERIIQDVYDEVDRRETVAAWNATMQGMQPIHLGNDQCVAVFLPPNPELSATRNQLRQKLAKCDVREFAMLIIDVLSEAKRRHFGLPAKSDSCLPLDGSTKRPSEQGSTNANVTGASDYVTFVSEDGNRDYDEVADSPQNKSRTSGSTRRSSDRKSDGSGDILQENNVVSIDDFLELKEKVIDTENKVAAVQQANTQILRMLTHLQSTVDRISADSIDLHGELRKVQDSCSQVLTRRGPSPMTVITPGVSVSNIPLISRSDSVGNQTSVPTKPPIEPLRVDSHGTYLSGGRRHGSIASPTGAYARSVPIARTPCTRNGSAPPTDYSSGGEGIDRPERHVRIEREARNASSERNEHTDRGQRIPFQQIFDSGSFPDSLIVETERLTNAIKLLLTDAQYGQLASRAPDHAHSIAVLIDRIMNVVPEERRTMQVGACLRNMSDATVILSAKCNAPLLSIDETCNAAYAVAKSAKQLLVSVHQH